MDVARGMDNWMGLSIAKWGEVQSGKNRNKFRQNGATVRKNSIAEIALFHQLHIPH